LPDAARLEVERTVEVVQPKGQRERCPFCGAKNARVVYKESELGDGRIAGEYRDEVRCPNPQCPGDPVKKEESQP
jgi:hypothetical protein